MFSELFCGTPPLCFDDVLAENGASSKIEDVLAEDGGLLHVLTLTVHLNFFLTDK